MAGNAKVTATLSGSDILVVGSNFPQEFDYNGKIRFDVTGYNLKEVPYTITYLSDETADSSLTFENLETNVQSIITFNTISTAEDLTIRLKPTDNYYVTKNRLDKYVKTIKEFISNPTSAKVIKQPSITNVSALNGEVTINVSKFESDLLLIQASSEYQIASDIGFSNIVYTKFTHDKKEFNTLTIPYPSLDNGSKCYVRVRVGGGDKQSTWSNVGSFIIDKPSLDTPSIEPITGDDIEYSYTTPFTVSLNLRVNKIENATRGVFTFYIKDGLNSYKKVYTQSVDDYTNVRFTDLFPNTLSYKREYYVSVKVFGENNSYSVESDKLMFSVLDLELSKINNLRSYPNIVNIVTPVIGFSDDLSVTIKGKVTKIPLTDLTSIEWVVTNNLTNNNVYTYSTKTNSLTIPKGVLNTSTSYTVKVYYKHPNLGNSDVSTYTFETTENFISVQDGLSSPTAVSGDIAYYGEIPANNLMPNNIEYVGDYDINKSYKKYQEVSKDGKVYLCVIDTPSNKDYTFGVYFQEADIGNAKNIYKSALPTPKWLLDRIGINYNINANSISDSNNNMINTDNNGWVKFTNRQNQTLYVSKLPILENISINDLIKADLFHPRRKTIRIGKQLYYIRMLVKNLEQGYDSLNMHKDFKNYYNSNLGSVNVINYGEDELLTTYLNSTFTSVDPNEVALGGDDYTELLYNVDDVKGYKVTLDLTNYILVGNDVIDYDSRTYTFRPVLELIPEDEYPVKNISNNIPGENDYNVNLYNFGTDTQFLGIVGTDDFLSSESLNLRSGLNSTKYIENQSWLKFYHRGLIYFISYGYNYKDIRYQDLLDHNLVYPTTLYQYGLNSSEYKLGKVLYNNCIYNITLPNVLNYPNRLKHFSNNRKTTNIFENTDNSINNSYYSWLTNTIYTILKDTSVLNNDNKGVKGKYPDTLAYNLIPSITGTDEVSTFYTRDTLKTGEVVLNYQKELNNIVEATSDTNNAIMVLTICPTIDKNKLWFKI